MRALAIAVALLMLCIGSARADGLNVKDELAQAHLAGQGSYRWFGIKLYEAYLWREQDVAAEALLDGSFVLELVYARALQGEKIAASSIDEIRKLNLGSPAQHGAWLSLMRQVFPDVQAGTRLSGVYQAGQGVRFYRDGVLLKAINDADFARAFFSIWLDERTSAPRLRRQLLGQAS
ncbi:chalcone isomerase family protein [Ferrigenium sp. UT5]|uniref:chalcone isomerase family protein n=1 Tax=Ferrigenium sp. UT5 TaxID=3242105 RepID=UPI00354C4D4F